jgi:TetR/AcrR family transcriptional regulator
MIDAIVYHQQQHLFVLQILEEIRNLKLQDMKELRMRIERHVVEYIKTLLETRLGQDYRDIPVDVTAFLIFRTYIGLIAEWPSRQIARPLELDTIRRAMLRVL